MDNSSQVDGHALVAKLAEAITSAIGAASYQQKEPDMQTVELQIRQWGQSGGSGVLTRKPWSDRYSVMQQDYLKRYFKELSEVNKATPLTPDSLRQVLSKFEPIRDSEGRVLSDRFATKRCIFDAYVSFVKYMIMIGKLSEIRLDEVKRYRPVRRDPPRKKFITTENIRRLINEIWTV